MRPSTPDPVEAVVDGFVPAFIRACTVCPRYSIENLLCMKKIIRRTVWLERMKVNLVIFNVRFIF